ncbi:MAG: adenylate/guanylate cyclase domain-containing protein, partial [Proteobacteria bacterium]
LEMRERMQTLGEQWRESGVERPLKVRMGIHTGYCTVGNFGSEDSMDYTIIGGAANTASRLESAATPGQILVSYETYAHVKNDVLCREHGTLEVKGMAYPLTTYEVVATFETMAQKRRRIVETHPNLAIDLDIDAMDGRDRARARDILSGALDTLEDADGADRRSTEETGKRNLKA